MFAAQQNRETLGVAVAVRTSQLNQQDVLSLVTCTSFFVGFLLAVGFIVSGNVLGHLAWRSRKPDQPRWRSWVGLRYLFRTEYYAEPREKTRFAAALCLGLGVVLGAEVSRG